MATGGAVIARPRVTLESAVEVAAVEEVVAEVVVPASNALLDRVRLVILQIRIQFFELERRLLVLGLDPRVVWHECGQSSLVWRGR